MDPSTTELLMAAVPPLFAALVATGLALRGRRSAGAAFAVGAILALVLGLIASAILGLLGIPAPSFAAWVPMSGWLTWPVLESPVLAGTGVLVGGVCAVVARSRNAAPRPRPVLAVVSAYALLGLVLTAAALSVWYFHGSPRDDTLEGRMHGAQRLVANLRSGNADVRRQAVAALTDLGRLAIGTSDVRPANTIVVPALIPLLKDPDDGVRTAAAEGVKAVGSPGKAAEPRLRELAQDSDERVLSAARQAFRQMEEAEAIDRLRGLGCLVFGGESLAAGPVTAVECNFLKLADGDLEPLKAFPHLRALRLMNTQLNDAALVHVVGRPELKELELYGMPLTDAGLEQLKPLTGLKKLNLGQTQITDAGLKSVNQLVNLEELYLDNTAVTDAGVKQLSGLSKLQTVYLRNTKVTSQGVKALRTALPKVRVVQGQPRR